MGLTSAEDEAQDLTDQVSFTDLLGACEASAVHVELRDAYFTDPWFQSWLDGDWDEFAARLERPWLDLIRSTVARGVNIRRLRVVSEPVSDYIAFEYDTAASNVAAGEDVRWLPRHTAADLLAPVCDLWVWDSCRLMFNHFSGDGSWSGAGHVTHLDDPQVAARHLTAIDALWQRAIPHAAYRPEGPDGWDPDRFATFP